MGDLSLRLLPDLGAGGGVVGQRIGRVAVLVRVEVPVGLSGRQFAGQTARPVGSGGGIGEGQLRTVGAQDTHPLRAGVRGQQQPDGEAQRRAEHRVSDASVARGGVEQCLAGGQIARPQSLPDNG